MVRDKQCAPPITQNGRHAPREQPLPSEGSAPRKGGGGGRGLRTAQQNMPEKGSGLPMSPQVESGGMPDSRPSLPGTRVRSPRVPQDALGKWERWKMGKRGGKCGGNVGEWGRMGITRSP